MKRNTAKSAPKKRIVDLVRRRGAVRSRDLDGLGLARTYLSRLVREGVLERHSRGLYALAGAEPTENRGLAEACRRVSHGVVCLLSALRFHWLTTQAPFEVWLAVPNKAWRPVPGYAPSARQAKPPKHVRSAKPLILGCYWEQNWPDEANSGTIQLQQWSGSISQ